MRSTFQPSQFGLATGSRAGEAAPWHGWPAPIAEALRSLAHLSPSLSFSAFGGGKAVFPRTAVRTPGPGHRALRIGLFGGFEALDDAAAQAEAATRLGRFPLDLSQEDGLLGLGIEARAYPVANPLALVDPDEALDGVVLRSRLWRGSRRPDAYYLERELGTHEFHLVCLVDADPSEPASVSASLPLVLDEVVGPVLDRLRLRSWDIAASPWRPGHSLLDGAAIAPAPLELRINYPLAADPERRNLSRLVAELLREYRAFLSYQDNL